MNSNSRIISTDEDPSLQIKSTAIINLRGVSTKLHKYIVFTNRGDFCRRCTKITLAHGFVLRILFILFDVKIFEGY